MIQKFNNIKYQPIHNLLENMKIFIPFFLLACLQLSCNENKTQTSDMELNETSRTIRINLDANTSLLTKALFCFSTEEGKEYLSLESNNKIVFFDLVTGNRVNTVFLESEGVNGVGQMFGHYSSNLDEIYVTRRNVPELYLVDKNGTVIEKYSYKQDKEGNLLSHTISSSIIYSPITEIEGILYLSQLPLVGNVEGQELTKSPLCITIDKKTKEIETLSLAFPQLWDSKDDFSLSEYSRTFDGEHFIYSFFWDENIYVTNIAHTETVAIPAKSDFFNALNKGMKRKNDFLLASKMYLEANKYGNLIHDPYRNLYYRFAYPGKELSKEEDIRKNIEFGRNFTIIILNSEFEKIGETAFPDKTYVPSLFFVAKDGLYLSTNHIDRADFSEDVLEFKCFELKSAADVQDVKEEQQLGKDTTIYTEVKYPPIIKNLEEVKKENKYKDWPADDSRRVVYSFVIEADGSVSNIRLERGETNELDEETLRLLHKLEIEPGKLESGEAVRTKSVFLMRFPD